MKKIIASLFFCIAIVTAGKAQIYDLVSHLNGWTGNMVNTTGAGQCPTYDFLCVHGGSSCGSSPFAVPLWKRIGSPNPTGTGEVQFVKYGGVEGMFTDFTFKPNEIYNIHIGIKGFQATGPSASLKLYATKDLVETPLSGNTCQEPVLSNLSSWTNPPRVCPPTYDAYEIGSIKPPVGGYTSLNYTFSVPSSFPFDQFALYYYSDHDNDYIVLDYVIIERICAPFGYVLTTQNPTQVDFYGPAARYGVAGYYNWNFGDGNTINGPHRTVTHTYTPSMWVPISYTPCLETYDRIGELCTGCRDLCLRGHVTKENPCYLDVIPDFKLDFPGPYGNVVLRPDWPYVNFEIEWGDGSTTVNGPTDAPHQYTAPGSYTICYKAYIREDCYVRTCMEICIPEFASFDGNTIGEDQQDDLQLVHEGKSGLMENEESSLEEGIVDQPVKGLMVSPNPVSSITTVTFQSSGDDLVSIVLYDVVGKTVLKQSKAAGKGVNQVNIDMSGMPSAVYMLEVKVGNRVSRNKLIKQ